MTEILKNTTDHVKVTRRGTVIATPTKVFLVLTPQALESCMTSWEDLFRFANSLSLRNGNPHPLFEVNRTSGEESDESSPDVVLLPALRIDGVSQRLPPPPSDSLKRRLTRWAESGSLVGAVCASVFTLAETGLLDGGLATTHWSLAEAFLQKFPHIKLDTSQILIEQGNLLLGGGMTAYFDVALKTIEKFGGRLLSKTCASIFLIEPGQRYQSAYVPIHFHDERYDDPRLQKAIDWARLQKSQFFGVEDWGRAIGLEKRTFERRSQKEWGMGPGEKLRLLRLDLARKTLTDQKTLSWETISGLCGYQDSSAFRRIFLERFGMSPGEYRRRFG